VRRLGTPAGASGCLLIATGLIAAADQGAFDSSSCWMSVDISVSTVLRSNGASRDEDIKLIEAEAKPMLAGSAGFKHYYFAQTGDRESVSVTVWDTEAHARAALEKLTTWRTKHFGSIIVGTPERHEGEVLVTG
jgi:hypothetical protein